MLTTDPGLQRSPMTHEEGLAALLADVPPTPPPTRVVHSGLSEADAKPGSTVGVG